MRRRARAKNLQVLLLMGSGVVAAAQIGKAIIAVPTIRSEDYERNRWPIDPSESIDAIRYRHEGYTQADLDVSESAKRRR
jgi:hypothetical protein